MRVTSFAAAAVAAALAAGSTGSATAQATAPQSSSAPARPAEPPAPTDKPATPDQKPAAPPAPALSPAQLREMALKALDADAARPDPAVRFGKLSNGLRYAVMSNAQPSRAVSLRLYLDVGSFEESDDERGVAHFIEHMAFNGSRSIPEGKLDTLMAGMGVAFGRDQNAFTTVWGTTYMLDLPVAEPSGLDWGFAWLRDVADGLNLKPEEVDRERGVILAERQSSMRPEKLAADQTAEFSIPELRQTTHDPIGELPALRSLDAGRLKSFYKRWYRPEHAVVVIVGDAPVEDLERRVKTTFASWTAQGPAPSRTAARTPDLSRGPDARTLEVGGIAPTLNLCVERPTDPQGPDTAGRMRRDLIRAAWAGLLQRRLSGLAERGDPPIIGGDATWGDDLHEHGEACLAAVLRDGDWKRGLSAVETEAARLKARAPAKAEVDEVMQSITGVYNGTAYGAAGRQTTDLAAQLLGAEVEGNVFAAPDERLRLAQKAAATITPEDVAETFRRDWKGAGPFLTVAGVPGATSEALKAELGRAETQAPPPDETAAAAAAWAYANFGKAGRVVRREEIAEPGFVRLWFSNGLIVNFKPATFARERVGVRVSFGRGRRDLDDADYLAAQMGAAMLTAGGLKKHDSETVRRLMSGHGWSLDMGVGEDRFQLSGDTNPFDLPTELQIIAAFLTEPGFRSNVDARLPTLADYTWRATHADPRAAAGQAVAEALAPGTSQVSPPAERTAALRSSDFRRLLEPALTRAPLEVTVVGAINEAQLVRAIAPTLGALPPRASFTTRGRPIYLRYPAAETAQPRLIRTVHQGSPEKAVAELIFPLYVASPARRREERTLLLLSKVYEDALRHRVREQMGKSYAPQVDMTSPDDADQGSINAVVETSPDQVDAVLAAMRATAAELAAGNITSEQLEAVRKPMLYGEADRMQTVDWWLATLDRSASTPEGIREMTSWESDFRSITLEEVKHAAAVWLSRAPIAAEAVPDPKAAGATTTAR